MDLKGQSFCLHGVIYKDADLVVLHTSPLSGYGLTVADFMQINGEDGAFYGPKIDARVSDTLKRKF